MFDTRDMTEQKIMENLTKQFRLKDRSFFMRPETKSRYGLLRENKIVPNMLKWITPIDKHLNKSERDILEAF